MFERFCRLLLRIYPSEFLRTYGDEAAQLIRDRVRDEQGVLKRARLLVDLTADLFAISLRGWHSARPLLANVDPRDGTPHFDIVEVSGPRPEALAVGLVTSTLMFAGFTLLFQPRAFTPAPAPLGAPSGSPQPVGESIDSEQQTVAATVVGETTAGRQHSGVFHRIDDHFGMGIQETAPPDNPFPVKGWDAIGVEPDVKVSSNEAFDAAKQRAESNVRGRIYAADSISLAALSTPQLRPAVPLEPIGAIIEAYKTHHVVALSEGTFHGDLNGHEFRLRLLRDPRFAATVNDVVVECGNARYQDVMDRFVRGDDVPPNQLRRVWQDTTQPGIECDLTIHEELYRAVRALNSSLPRDRQIRLLVGDPPIEWDEIHTTDDIKRWMSNPQSDRDRFPADLIRREVLAKNRRALIVYGAMHLQRSNLFSNYDMSAGLSPTIVHELERNGDTKVFTIWGNANLDKLQPDVASWPRPSLALVRGTDLGAADFTFYHPSKVRRVHLKDGNVAPVPEDEWKSLRMEDQADAVLYPGPASIIQRAEFPRSLCRDTDYLQKRLARIALVGFPPQAQRLREVCGLK